MSDLLNGLLLYEPQTFLFPTNYVLTLQRQIPQSAGVTAAIGLYLLLFGFRYRRVTAAILSGAAWFAVGGCIAMTTHTGWPYLPYGLAALGAAAGYFLPRLNTALVTAFLAAICVRSLALQFDLLTDTPYELFAGAFSVSFAVAFLAWMSWNVIATSLIGAALIVFSAPWPLDSLVITTAITVLTLIGMVVQLKRR